jgi:hypothetical protein
MVYSITPRAIGGVGPAEGDYSPVSPDFIHSHPVDGFVTFFFGNCFCFVGWLGW